MRNELSGETESVKARKPVTQSVSAPFGSVHRPVAILGLTLDQINRVEKLYQDGCQSTGCLVQGQSLLLCKPVVILITALTKRLCKAGQPVLDPDRPDHVHLRLWCLMANRLICEACFGHQANKRRTFQTLRNFVQRQAKRRADCYRSPLTCACGV